MTRIGQSLLIATGVMVLVVGLLPSLGQAGMPRWRSQRPTRYAPEASIRERAVYAPDVAQYVVVDPAERTPPGTPRNITTGNFNARNMEGVPQPSAPVAGNPNSIHARQHHSVQVQTWPMATLNAPHYPWGWFGAERTYVRTTNPTYYQDYFDMRHGRGY